MFRRIIGITGISLWAGLIVVAVIAGFAGDNIELAKKASYELGIKPMPIETQAKDLVNSLASGDYREAVENFDSTMQKALPAEKLKEVWNSLIAQVGAFVEQTAFRKEKILQYEAVFVTCKFENAVLDAKVVFDRKKQVAGLFFVPPQFPADE
ncbi:MAG: DUF3887 domain-containing protein [Planctomycetota bacterium]|jgi:hypothetical protein